jgi:hypothetical protein
VKTIIFILLISTFSVASARADYIGRFARYVTTVHTKNSSELQCGKSETKVISLDPSTQKYVVQVTNQDSQGIPEITTALFSSTELDGQQQGTLFNHCTDNYGTISSASILVKGASFQPCVIESSNTEMDVAMVPFSVVKSISQGAGGQVFTTTLVDYQF